MAELLLPKEVEIESRSTVIYRGRRDWYEDEARAREEQADGRLCYTCKARMPRRPYTVCVPCRYNAFMASPAEPWDGETALCEWDGAQFVHTPDDLEILAEESECAVGELAMVLCERDSPPVVDVERVWDDWVCEAEWGCADPPECPREVLEFGKRINAIFAKADPGLWIPTNRRVDLTGW